MYEIPASALQPNRCTTHGPFTGRYCPSCLEATEQPTLPIDEPVTPTGAGAGSRGGKTLHVDEAVAILETAKGEELATVKGRIMEIASRQGNVHADDVDDVQVTQRNVIGVAFKELVAEGLLEQTAQHRPSRTKAKHGRRSYVYAITMSGREYAELLERLAA